MVLERTLQEKVVAIVRGVDYTLLCFWHDHL